MHRKVKSSTMEPRSQDTSTSVYGPQFPSTNFGLQPLCRHFTPRYSFIACACARMNELKTLKRSKKVWFKGAMSHHFSIFLKSQICLSLNWIPKIMVQVCYLRLYYDVYSVSCHLLLRMARMEMDWNLKKFG